MIKAKIAKRKSSPLRKKQRRNLDVESIMSTPSDSNQYSVGLDPNGENEDQDDTFQSAEEGDIDDQAVESQEDQIIDYDSDQAGMKLDSPTYNPAAEAEAEAQALRELCELVQKDYSIDTSIRIDVINTLMYPNSRFFYPAVITHPTEAALISTISLLEPLDVVDGGTSWRKDMQILIETAIKPLSDHKYFTLGTSLHGIMHRLKYIPNYVRSHYSRLHWTLQGLKMQKTYLFPAQAEEIKVFHRLIRAEDTRSHKAMNVIKTSLLNIIQGLNDGKHLKLTDLFPSDDDRSWLGLQLNLHGVWMQPGGPLIRDDGAFDAVLLAALMVVVDPNISSAQDGNSPVSDILNKVKALNWKADGLNQNRIDQNLLQMTKILNQSAGRLTQAYGKDEYRVIKVFRTYVAEHNTALANLLFTKHSQVDPSGPTSITKLVELKNNLGILNNSYHEWHRQGLRSGFLPDESVEQKPPAFKPSQSVTNGNPRNPEFTKKRTHEASSASQAKNAKRTVVHKRNVAWNSYYISSAKLNELPLDTRRDYNAKRTAYRNLTTCYICGVLGHNPNEHPQEEIDDVAQHKLSPEQIQKIKPTTAFKEAKEAIFALVQKITNPKQPASARSTK